MSTLAQTNAWRGANVKQCFPPNRRAAKKSLAALPDRARVKRTAPIRVVSVVLLAVCGALCQKRPSAELLPGQPFGSSSSPETQRQQMSMRKSLPDAPSSVQPATQTERFHTFVKAMSSALTPGEVGASAPTTRETDPGRVTCGQQPSLTARYPNAFLDQSLYPPLLKEEPRYYYPLSSSGSIGRATYGASRIVITRNDSGKARLNASQFIGVLSSIALHSAYRPYSERAGSATFNNFGSTLGSDAKMNVFDEFGPGIHQMVKGLTPKFVSRIEERITRGRTPRV